MKKLTRDKVVSIVNGKDLVGVYWKGTNGRKILFETSPIKADKIIEVFNGERMENKDSIVKKLEMEKKLMINDCWKYHKERILDTDSGMKKKDLEDYVSHID